MGKSVYYFAASKMNLKKRSVPELQIRTRLLVQTLYFGFEIMYKFEIASNSVSQQMLDAISYNGLAYFLVANVATGLVNLALPTIQGPIV